MLRLEHEMVTYDIEITGTGEDYQLIDIYDTWEARTVFEGEIMLDEDETVTDFILNMIEEYTQ